jgi:transcription elongation GreA/GreB family factor
MSRAFVNEDSFVEELPDRPVSEHPNLVTARGLALIEDAAETARRAYGEAQAAADRSALAAAGRELRYWSARRASAKVTIPRPELDVVQFGSVVTIVRDDGRRQIFRIVGEDEADPSQGSMSHMAPLARALLGKRVGDAIRAGSEDAEITAVRHEPAGT